MSALEKHGQEVCAAVTKSAKDELKVATSRPVLEKHGQKACAAITKFAVDELKVAMRGKFRAKALVVANALKAVKLAKGLVALQNQITLVRQKSLSVMEKYPTKRKRIVAVRRRSNVCKQLPPVQTSKSRRNSVSWVKQGHGRRVSMRSRRGSKRGSILLDRPLDVTTSLPPIQAPSARSRASTTQHEKPEPPTLLSPNAVHRYLPGVGLHGHRWRLATSGDVVWTEQRDPRRADPSLAAEKQERIERENVWVPQRRKKELVVARRT